MSQIAPVMHREPVELDTRYIPKALRAKVFAASAGRCALCADKIAVGAWECDHAIRWSDGGRTAFDNLQALCLPCHAVKTRAQDTPGAAKTKRMAKAGAVREADEKPVSRLRSNPKIAAHVDPWGKRRRKKAPNAQQALSGGAERSDCETNPNTTTKAPHDQ